MTSPIERLAAILPTQRQRLAATLLLLTLTLAGGLALIAYQSRPSATSTGTGWLQVQRQPLENRLGLIGRIEAATRQTLTAPFDGLVQRLTITEGQRVDRDQLLLTLDTTQLDIQLRQALAELLKARRTVRDMQDWTHSDEVARARRAVTNAELNLNDTAARLADTRRLFERGIVARMEVEALEQQLRLQRLDLDASRTELRAAREKGQGESRQIAEMELANAQSRHDGLQALRDRRELRAPFAGIVLRPQKIEGTGSTTQIQAGQRVGQGTPLLELASLERLNATTRIEEADLHQLREGMPVQITGDGFDGLVLQGRVLAIGAQAIPSETYGSGSTYEVVVAIDPLSADQQQRVRLGMSARLAVVTYRTESGLAVPAEALRRDDDGTTFIIHRSDMHAPLQRTEVTTGRAVPQGVEVFGMEPGYVELPVP
ncbi:efflux RND transporter periplasmic adaptor subunit [Azotobacter vinelandii]|uniref:efflux RND transporter periplasmic adaptor subunit n=1 Tax=Azotobacter vinelandii TaxID=354 RepID=UPI0009E90469|nr:HlyD family efflux transporter periplasmic adaptor subunit [Azotobacter vinelandii]